MRSESMPREIARPISDLFEVPPGPPGTPAPPLGQGQGKQARRSSDRASSLMPEHYRFRSWIIDEYNWARGALPLAIVALALLPIFLTASNRPLVLLSTLLPVYMLHQYEEHAHGRFVPFFNATIGGGFRVLTPVSAFWINILAVWVVFVVAFSLARYWTIGLAFVPIYLTLINAASHVIPGVVLRRAIPGLVTSLLLFVPWGGFLLVYFGNLVARDLLWHAIGLAAGLLGHAAVIGYAVRRRRTLASTFPRG